MSEKLFEWLKKDMEQLEAKVDKIDSELNEKMDRMLQFKWQIVGGASVTAFIVGVLINILIAVIGRT